MSEVNLKDAENIDKLSSQKFLNNMYQVSAKYQEILNLLAQKSASYDFSHIASNKNIEEIISEYISQILGNPQKLYERNMQYMKQAADIVDNTISRFLGQDRTPPIYQNNEKDRRFKDKAWDENIYFNFLKQMYLMTCSWNLENIDEFDIDEKKKHSAKFFSNLMLDALSPSNFISSNPTVWREAIESEGQSLVNGLENLKRDLEKSKKVYQVTTTDHNVFKLGENIATTKGKIVYENDLMQLICYKPEAQSHATPILISPPWINKFYILDLTEENSFIQYLVKNNFQVFLISWVNPDKNLANKTFENYMEEGLLSAVNYITDKLGFKSVNTIGYCLGGTLLASFLAAANEKVAKKLGSATFLTTLLDFSEPGDLGIFINKDRIEQLQQTMQAGGVFDAELMSSTFSMLRANDMIWSFVVNNYLLGKEPLPFDLLYWNSDSTNMPAAMHAYYLKNMYLENNLCKKNRLEFLGKKIDLSTVKNPIFFLSTKEDHIAPWASTYKGVNLFGSQATFCLADSGHVAGVINPPKKNKYCYWTNKIKPTAQEWWLTSDQHPGSWWDYWTNWQKEISGNLQNSIDYEKLESIELAPGRYVKKQAIEG